ncbi:BETA-ADAPTIN (CLATHRIN ASSEMBLY PROTEIN LARGE BETA CHAIN) [Encephalitozoon cuniculi GB-M1]|uniref:BETA-ADAPTIN (CLATHRIN ASSEMBLY PROTEIN LARGE BETA CHAIN) n=1 Tax=Encephalitozoon cuniculi (strain GB-M1) TaxID=284813 RepID=Q8SRQ9_ENCCU|nr:uncharacterized protein ECU06_0770 [Encephalitozoon cuniculi GB-M1]CAD25437.1 BETA-ADAPTIN (CLATHRIN ASSEMBLY PROTEIN LARGE BETA CHAIN) [Encephalitozoon cuniculi GB-M1]
MGIKDAFGMDGIRKLFNDDSFVANPLGRSQIVKYISSSNIKKQIQGARSLVSRMQCGEDLFELCNDVIKATDTRDVEFKRMLNLYLVRYTQGWPAKQLICINTMLKDFGDESSEIRHCAIQDSGLLGDGAVIKNYINPLKEHGTSGLAETRRKVADSLRNYFRRDPRLFHAEGLCDLLKDLVFDEDADVCASALSSVRVLEEETRVLSTEEIHRLLRVGIESGNREVLGSLLEVMKNRAEDFPDPSPLLQLLRSCCPRIFYLASSLIISIDPSYRQTVFDHLQGFFDSSDEKLYLVLDYAESLIEHVSYDNSCFAIYHNDKRYNKVKKLRLLFRKLDAVSMEEIKRQCRDGELLGTILQESLRADYLIEEPFKDAQRMDEVIRVLYDADSIAEKWNGLIREFLAGARGVQERQKYIYLCGRYVDKIPSEVVSIQDLNIPSLTNETIRFYLNLHRRGVLCLEETLEYLRMLQKTSKDRVKMVASELKARGIRVFGAFCDTKKRDLNGTCPEEPADTECSENVSSILDIKPYYELEEGKLIANDFEKAQCEPSAGEQPLSRGCFSSERVGEDVDRASPVVEDSTASSGHPQPSGLFLRREDEENVWLRFAESQRSTGDRRASEEESTRLIDTGGLKGILSIAGDEVVLQVDVLERPLVIYYKCKGRLNSIRIDAEETFPLFTVNLPVINSKFRLTIGKSVYEIHLGIRSLMRPCECQKDEFEKRFKELRDYILLKEFNMEKTYVVDSYSFSFSVLGSRFYGKHLDGQVILKGPKRLLGLF